MSRGGGGKFPRCYGIRAARYRRGGEREKTARKKESAESCVPGERLAQHQPLIPAPAASLTYGRIASSTYFFGRRAQWGGRLRGEDRAANR